MSMTTTNTNTPNNERKTTYKPPRDEAEAQRRREYSREYRRNHPDAVRRWNRTYYLRQAAKALQQAAQIAAATGEGEVK